MPRFPTTIRKGELYSDSSYTYMNVQLTESLYRGIAKGRILSSSDLSKYLRIDSTWEHFSTYKPEPHIIMLRTPKSTIL